MTRKTWLAFGAALLIGLAGVTSGVAQTAGAAVVNWWVMAGGGNPASAGTVTINDTLGQPVTGASVSSDGKVFLGAGYWPSGSLAPSTNHIYLPIVQR